MHKWMNGIDELLSAVHKGVQEYLPEASYVSHVYYNNVRSIDMI